MQTTKLTLALTAAALCAACQTVPPSNVALEEAHETYQAAASDPRAQKYAQVELNRAREALTYAEAEWRDRGDVALTEHLAYLAKQRALTATEVGVRRHTEERIAVASQERDRLLAEARALGAEQRADLLQQDLQALQAKQTERGVVVTLSDVMFDVDSAVLRPGAARTLDHLAQALRSNPERRVLIEGFTDSQGNDAYSLDLSARRAGSVQQALVDRGVSPDRIVAQGLGESFPVATNSTVTGRQLNRRVEIVFSDAAGQIASRSAMSGRLGAQPRVAP